MSSIFLSSTIWSSTFWSSTFLSSTFLSTGFLSSFSSIIFSRAALLSSIACASTLPRPELLRFPSDFFSATTGLVAVISTVGTTLTLPSNFCSSIGTDSVRPILRSVSSTLMTFTSSLYPGLITFSMSSEEEFSVNPSSLMCRRPSRLVSSSMKTPKFAIFEIVPRKCDPMRYFPGMYSSHGSPIICFRPRAIRFLSLSIERTTASIGSPSVTTSFGCEILRVQLMSETCNKPSKPSSISTNAP